MKKILIYAVAFAMIALLPSCAQKTHYRFEKIRNTYFRENTRFLAMHNLLWVIDRDKLVCADPSNGEMKEYVDLPGYCLDFKSTDSSLGMIFKSSNGFLFREYSLNSESPHIAEKRSFAVEGSRFLLSEAEALVLFDEPSKTISSYNNGKLAGKIVLEKPCKVGFSSVNFMGYALSHILVYDGQTLTFAGFDDNGKIEYPSKGMPQIKLTSKDLDKSATVINDYGIACIYDGDSFNFVMTDDNYRTYKINTVQFPGLNSFKRDSINVYASSGKGLFIIDYEEPTRISDSRFDLIDSMKLKTATDGRPSINAYLLGMQLGEGYKVGLIKSTETTDMNTDKTGKPDIMTFDALPKGAACVKLALINDRHFVYAFTSEGLFKSEPLE